MAVGGACAVGGRDPGLERAPWASAGPGAPGPAPAALGAGAAGAGASPDAAPLPVSAALVEAGVEAAPAAAPEVTGSACSPDGSSLKSSHPSAGGGRSCGEMTVRWKPVAGRGGGAGKRPVRSGVGRAGTLRLGSSSKIGRAVPQAAHRARRSVGRGTVVPQRTQETVDVMTCRRIRVTRVACGSKECVERTHPGEAWRNAAGVRRRAAGSIGGLGLSFRVMNFSPRRHPRRGASSSRPSGGGHGEQRTARSLPWRR